LAAATDADWIHFHDVDDEIAPGYLTKVGDHISENHDLILHFVDFIDEQTRQLVVRWQFSELDMEIDAASVLLRGPMPTMSSLIRRSFFLSVGGFNETYRCFEDGDLHFRLAARGARITAVPEVLEWSLRHDGGAGADQRYCFECRVAFLEGYVETLPDLFHETIAKEAERAAVAALRLGDDSTADRAIALAQRLGLRLPSSNNALMNMARFFAPAATLLRLQDRWRTGSH
jgi:hypothetical protein